MRTQPTQEIRDHQKNNAKSLFTEITTSKMKVGYILMVVVL
jgi:hypothetical protein